MSEAKGNGHNPATERMIAVLERIEAELRGFRAETREELLDLRGEIRATHERLTELRRARLQRLEAAVFKRTGT